MIRFEHVDKAYDLQAGRRTVFASLKLVTSAPASDELFHALSDVSFQIERGEAFGIIGRNGAGKSTILKIIAGITAPTRGKVTVNGRVSSLIELGAGFHPDLTGRENVYMSGAILGMPKKYIDDKFKEIVDFAELWDFIDVPVKKYSSGMYARLGFSVAVSVDPEILIIDEILSVGDVFFQQKCFTKMREIIKQGTTFIYVTHDTAGMQNLCDRALLLDGGKVEFVGETTEAVSRYFAKVGTRSDAGKSENRSADAPSSLAAFVKPTEEIVANSVLGTSRGRHGAMGLEIVAVRVTDTNRNDTLVVPMEGDLLIDALILAREFVEEPRVGFNLYDRMGNLIFAAGSPQLRHRLPSIQKDGQLIVSFRVTFSVAPGEYTFLLNASEPTADGKPNAGFFHDVRDTLGPITVTADESQTYPFYGFAKLPMKISHHQLGFIAR
jgi:ABC-type polysaccharide/polyol phosphate transport system ATPase subunit